MAKANRLTTRIIDRINAPGIYGDGNTLYLKVRDDGTGGRGSAQWVQILHIEGKRYERGLGGYPIVPLEYARQVAFDNRRRAKLGDNPFAKAAVAEVAPTFAEALEAVIASQSVAWRDPRTEADWRNSMNRYAMPTLGSKRVDAIEGPDVLACLEPLWQDKRDTGEKVKRRISAVMAWAIGKQYRKHNPVFGLDDVLPKKRNAGRTHQKALPFAEVPDAIATIRQCNAYPTVKMAFEFLVLTAARSKEVRLATFNEIDWEDALWTIPASRMKAHREHVVPLPKQAMAILREAKERYGDDGPIFPADSGKPLYDYRLSKVVSDNGIDAVPHGFRSSFRGWAGEHGWHRDLAEAALAHTIKNAVEAAYHRNTYLEKRRKMMAKWAKFCFSKV